MQRRRRLPGSWCQAAVIAVAAALVFVHLPAGPVERLYSNGAYPFVQPLVTSLSNRTRYALLDALILGVTALWFLQSIRDLRHRQGVLRNTARIASRTVVWSATLYVAFMALWGLNYRRQPLSEKLGFHADAVTADAARGMAEASLDQANPLYGPAHMLPGRHADGV